VVGQPGASSREIHEYLSRFLEQHQIHPPVAEVYEFEDAKQALDALSTLNKPGKIVVRA